ncbi:MAG: cysteine desulfurase [Thermodesulfovibrionales bacterium]|nr:cysteine desulfurase [Thermodesulfovibrionales bacterium]
MKKPIYLDYNATTPHDPEVIYAMIPYLETHFGNPSSSHHYGLVTKEAIENARIQVASLLNCLPEEIIFTSGGTESNNHAIKGITYSNLSKGNHIITSQIEHPSVLEVCKYLENNGFEVTYIPVDESGLVNPYHIERAITDKTILISIMHANNEVGTIEPIEEIAEIAIRYGIFLHTDAAQSVGKIPVDVKTLKVDLLTVAGHKLYAPKGVGALYAKKGIELTKFIHGAGQERGLRAGTENVIEIVGLGKACEIAKRDLEKNYLHMLNTRELLYNGIKERIKGVRLNGHLEKRLPNTLSLSFKGISAHAFISKIKDYLAVSVGSACHSDHERVSPVLQAMGVPFEWAKGTIRFSTGKMTTEEEIKYAIEKISEVLG